MALPPKTSTVLPKDFVGISLAVESLVTYQKNAVVSKQILNKKAGSLTIFAFDKGEGLSEHTAPYDAVVQVLDGEAEVVIAGKPIKVLPGEIVIMPANVPHAVRAVKKFKMLLTMIREK